MKKKLLQKIFKTVSYKIFLKIYGKIENSIDSKSDDRIKVKIVNINKDLSYRIFNVTDGRLYTDRIHDTAVLLDNKIINEPSFQLRYKGPFIGNSDIKENIVFKKGTPRKLKNLEGTVLSLLTGGGGNKNYSHWLFDVLPRLALCNKTINLNEINYFLLPDHVTDFQIETLDCLNIPKYKRLSSQKFRHIKAKKLIITDHPVVVSGNPTEDIINMPIWISKWLKEKFLTQTIKNDQSNIKKIYIDRDDTNLKKTSERFVSNEDEIKRYLLKENFIFVKLHELKFIDQVKLFYNAKYVVGLHGAGFANIVFCKSKARIVELRGVHSGKQYENLAKSNDLDYNSITVIANQNRPNQQGSIHIPIESLVNLLKSFE